MAPKSANPQLSRKELKEAVRRIVLTQGNHFIKELLRKNSILIGATKADFEANLLDAIDKQTLTQPMIEAWLEEVDGWGNQHIYLFAAPLTPRAQLASLLAASPFRKLVGQPVSYAFPDQLALSAVVLTPANLSMSWHRSNCGWERAKSKDRQEIEGLERYEYRAYREWFDRSVVRFEWRFADPFAALMLQLPNDGDEHTVAMGCVWADLKAAGITAKPLARASLSAAFKRLSRRPQAAMTQSEKVMTDGGYVEFVSTLADGGIGDVEPVRQVQRGVDDAKFKTADGMFNFRKATYAQLSRDVKIHGYGGESRIRIWVQCKREDVYLVIDTIWQNRSDG